jgi:hypothetical protein
MLFTPHITNALSFSGSKTHFYHESAAQKKQNDNKQGIFQKYAYVYFILKS